MGFLMGVIVALGFVGIIVSIVKEHTEEGLLFAAMLGAFALLISMHHTEYVPRAELADCIINHNSIEICDKLNHWKDTE